MRWSPTATIFSVWVPDTGQLCANAMSCDTSVFAAVLTVPSNSPSTYTRAWPRPDDRGVIHATLRPVNWSVALAPAFVVYRWLPSNAFGDEPSAQPPAYCSDVLLSWTTPTCQAGPATAVPMFPAASLGSTR